MDGDSTRRTEIVQAAAELFSEHGYEATSVRNIADRIGLLSGSLYAHISSKQELLFEIVRRAILEFIGELTPVVHSKGIGVNRLAQAMKVHVAVIARMTDYAKVATLEWRHLPADERQQVEELRATYYDLWSSIIEDGMADGSLRKADSSLVRLVLLSVPNYMIMFRHDDPAYLADETIVDRILDLLAEGLVPRPEL